MLSKLRNRSLLLKSMLAGDVAENGPFFVGVEVTGRCNLRCVGCRSQNFSASQDAPAEEGGADMPLSLYKQICRELHEAGTDGLVITGDGEPLIHPDIVEMVRYAKELGFHLTLITNGTLLDERMCRMLVEYKPDVLQVSFWGADNQAYEKCMQGVGENGFEKAVARLKLLARVKAESCSDLPFVRINHPITRYNAKSITKMEHLCLETCSQAVSFSPLKDYEGNFEHLSLDRDETDNVVADLELLRDRFKRRGLSHLIDNALLRFRVGRAVWEMYPCYLGWVHCRVKPDGTVLPCKSCETSPEGLMGQFGQDTFPEIWNSDAFVAFRRQSRTLSGLESISRSCDCEFCCHLIHSYRISRSFRWFAPLEKLFYRDGTTSY